MSPMVFVGLVVIAVAAHWAYLWHHHRRRPCRSVMAVLVSGIVVLVALFILWIVGGITWRTFHRVAGAPTWTVGTFTKDGQADDALARTFHARWSHFQGAAGEGSDPARDAKGAGGKGSEPRGDAEEPDDASGPEGDVTSFMGSDFVMAEIEARSSSDVHDIVGKWASSLEIKVGGVSVDKLIEQAVELSGASRTIEASLDHSGGVATLSVTLDGRRLGPFQRSVGDAASQPAEDEALLDEGICAVAIAMSSAEKKPATEARTFARRPAALAALRRGQLSLGLYLRNGQPRDLAAAESNLGALAQAVPEYSDGQALLGFVLAEGRKEREAILTFDRALAAGDLDSSAQALDRAVAARLEGPSWMPEGDDAGAWKRIRRAAELRFLRARSKTRCFRTADVLEAIADFQHLAAALSALTSAGGAPPIVAEDWAPFLLSRVYAEEAYAVATQIILLNKDKDEEIKGRETFDERRRAAEGYYDEALALLDRSRRMAPPSGDGDVRRQTRRRAKEDETEARRKEIEGFARYRFAEWRGHDDGAFTEDCEAAVAALREAERKPPSYSLLLNLGLVQASRRWDQSNPDGDHLNKAKYYFDRSVKLKPGDYYGHEELARVNLRLAFGARSRELQQSALDASVASLKTSTNLRGDGFTGAFLRVLTSLVQVSIYLDRPATDSSKPNIDEAIQGILYDLDRIDKDAKDPTFRWMRLVARWFKLRRQQLQPQPPPQQQQKDDYAKAIGELTGDIEQFLKDTGGDKCVSDCSWRLGEMRDSISKLLTQSDAPSPKDRFTLPFDLAGPLE